MDLRCRELCWVDDWGREVLESGVTVSTSPKHNGNSPPGRPDDSTAEVETEKQETSEVGLFRYRFPQAKVATSNAEHDEERSPMVF